MIEIRKMSLEDFKNKIESYDKNSGGMINGKFCRTGKFLE